MNQFIAIAISGYFYNRLVCQHHEVRVCGRFHDHAYYYQETIQAATLTLLIFLIKCSNIITITDKGLNRTHVIDM